MSYLSNGSNYTAKPLGMANMGKVQVGHQAPMFTCKAVVDGRFEEVSLSAYNEANHWVILVFFPKAWSFVCPTEIKAFSARHEEFLYARSCAVVFASTDHEHGLKAWNATSDLEGGLGGMHVPLIADCSHKLSRDYGVLIEDEGVAQRALFIIDPRGRVRSIAVNDADVGRSVDETQRVLDALIFKDEFGEGCPVDWKKGDKGIDLAARNRVEGSVELKDKRSTWSEWARPKLNRAWSNASQRSSTSAVMSAVPDHRMPTLAAAGVYHTRDRSSSSLANLPQAGLTSGQHSPAVPMSPTSHGLAFEAEQRLKERMEEGMSLSRPEENMRASRTYSALSVGWAN